VDYAPEDLAIAKKLSVGAFSKIPGDYYRSVDIVGRSMEANFTLFLNTMLVRNTRLSADSGIPVYYPFLSERMLEIARRLPFKLRFDQSGNAKPTLREICRRNLDSAVIEWPKIGFVTPENEWLRDDLRSYLDIVLSNTGGISKVLGVSFGKADAQVIKKSARLGWWLMTLDRALLNTADVVQSQNLNTYD
jgi:asparagine synthetase B (glutamine-hydrolysing)